MNSPHPYRDGTYVYHREQKNFALTCPGGTARVLSTSSDREDWYYTVTCAMNKHERPGLTNPRARVDRWRAADTIAAYPLRPAPKKLVALDNGMALITELADPFRKLAADYLTARHTDAATGIWTPNEAIAYRDGIMDSGDSTLHTLYLDARTKDLGIQFTHVAEEYRKRDLAAKILNGEA